MKKFENQITTTMNMGLKSMISMLKDAVKGRASRRPSVTLAIEQFKVNEVNANSPRITWFGHSAFYLEIEGKKILFDPMFNLRPSPVPWVGTKRYTGNLLDMLDDFPQLDAVMISHDHYDHLDDQSIQRLKDKASRFIVPLGVRKHLIKWGVAADKISEHDWWEEIQFNDLTLACTPARHFSGRGLHDRNTTLWCSWVILGQECKVFYSGDSGYGPHFKDIGKRYGPFNVTLMECGQYDERWSAIHMKPEETVQAHLDVKGDLLLPVHWGGFTLAYHAWTDPVERAMEAALKNEVRMLTPKIGETVLVDSKDFPSNLWWRHL